jgi:mannose-6-phosphate isomerase-like protein (cupin superfamily)
MAHEGQQIFNPRTGQRMTFLELREELLRIDSANPHNGAEREPGHVHPKQESGAEVISGSLMFEVDGSRSRVGPGESIVIPANTPHRFWNEEAEDAHSIQFFKPALDIASFFETFFALAQQGKLDDKGMPRPLQLAVLVSEFEDELRPLSPPWPLLKALATVLGPLARARGYRGRIAVDPASGD